ncbi:MAG: efflux RND transporter permease subunit [Moraxellaceae bacterium]|nr:efflux RND transporter permease subunit [Moraxellaceae bacterium]MBP9045298.1 efflux RND transporter permease subunit [Moraxellaceae bacterium]MBP9730645.1 efflux RND transporter permease subunit [Moraxellaceae bacterium]HQV41880.1 efflux RND transporter permease subunit [Moraxellaceae bacterium]HQX89901.1 efflux RND transporter permease subunit [Moraxellaceae bacterium]
MAKFFVDRPVFAWVIALIIVLAGLLSIRSLPVSQYPSIAPPTIAISATYPGASAQTVEDTVTSVIEQEMNGAEGLQYMYSTSESSGSANITLAFKSGMDIDLASVEVQNRLKRVESRLPSEVRSQGVRVDKAGNNFLMFVILANTDGKLTRTDLANYASASILDPLRRVEGVGDITLFGSEYAMRIWLNPARLTGLKMTPADVTAAIRDQNMQVAGGALGGLPAVAGQDLNATVIVPESRLSSPEQFGNIILRANPDGSVVRLSDVARVELGAADYSVEARLNGKPVAGLGVKLAPSANALATATAVRAKMAELSPYFPEGMNYEIPYDTSKFVKISIEEVVKTLIEAIILVFLVMYLFLQNLRATLIPTIVVPVALLGTMAVMLVFGFSINVLTMFGMVLAIGILVDDAIVVVENVERIMVEEGLPPREATRKAMGQISGAIIGMTLVLVAVFIPMAFFSGSVGNIYRQFSLSLVASISFSALLALTLTPALCATLLRPIAKGQQHEKKGFFGWFNRGFARTTTGYQGVVARMLGKAGRYMVIYVLIVVAVGLLFTRLPSSFLPEEDQGYFLSVIMLPTGATQERTLKVLGQLENYYVEKETNVDTVVTVAGFSFFGRGQNGGIAFATLKPWEERTTPDSHVSSVVGRAFGYFMSVKDAIIFPLNPPPIPELGNSSGFDFRLQDRSGLGHEKLVEARNMMLGLASQSKVVVGLRPEGQEDAPQLQVDVDREKARALGLQMTDINTTLGVMFGSSYVNDFVRAGRVQKVLVQGDAPERMLPEDILALRVRNSSGTMVPFSTFATAKWVMGSPRLERYNGFPSVKLAGNAAPGLSTGDAMAEMEALFAKLPPGFGYEWSGQSYEERISGAQAPALYALSVLVVFLVLAALYESWSIPFSVIMVVPLGVLGAVLGVTLRGMPDDVYFKVGLIAVVGLSAKNAILIIEFAKDLQAQGKGLIEATLEAVHLRFRPILMTSLAFILGVLPLVMASGAGSASQRAIGTGVMGGMITATVLAVFFVPVFFVVVRSLFKGSERQRRLHAHETDDEAPEHKS